MPCCQQARKLVYFESLNDNVYQMLHHINRWRPVSNYTAPQYLEAFFVASIATVLGIRLFLHVTGYPQIGNDSLHIAHVLWGGLLMMLAVVILLNFLGERPRAIGAIAGGIGFGFFIDELGKFLTQDNDYFFKPTALLLYALFIVLWFLFQELDKRRSNTHKARAANIINLLNEGLIFGFNPDEKAHLNALVKTLDHQDPMERALAVLAKEIELKAKADEPGWYAKLSTLADRYYERFIRWRYMPTILLIVFILQGILSLYNLVDSGWGWLNDSTVDSQTTRANLGQLTGGLIYSAFVLIGLYRLRTNRERGFKAFRVALLVNIFVTQLFAFYNLQFWAVFGLALNLLLLTGVNYVLHVEHQRKS